jgi:hypothetical protein
MKVIPIVIIWVIIALLFKACISGDRLSEDVSRPAADKKPVVEKKNDKLIVVSNVKHDDIKSVLVKFCNIYNKNSYQALPRLAQINASTFAITFPYDINFTTFCFMVNFMKYPVDVNWDSQVMAWATAKRSDGWVTDKCIGKKVMLFVADDDREYDNVFLTTRDNIGYKLGFATGKEKQLLDTPKQKFTEPEIDINNLKTLKFEDIE